MTRPTSDDDDEFEDTPLRPRENRKFRRMERDYGRVIWFVKTIRTCMQWFTGTAITAAVLYNYVAGWFKGIRQ